MYHNIKDANTSQIFIGTSGWSYEHWKSLFYPNDCPKSRWLEYYADRFSAVEVNATFYRTFKDQTYQKWRNRAPETFKYVLKVPRVITHRNYLSGVEEQITAFWKSASLLQPKLGMILLQLAPQTPYDPERLKKALLTFGDPTRVAVEFRDNTWFTEEIKALLKGVGSSFCNADSPKTHLIDWVTSEVVYIRLHGRKKWYAYDYSRQELREIINLIQEFKRHGAKTFYVFFNNDFEGYAPRNALSMKEMIQREW